jgi:hypothetical protein
MTNQADWRTSPPRARKFQQIAAGKTPGSLLDTEEISGSTLARWEKQGWIEDRGERRFAFVTLTIKGYRAA